VHHRYFATGEQTIIKANTQRYKDVH